jgi:hypothetical protein
VRPGSFADDRVLLRAFRRHYRKARDLYKKLGSGATLRATFQSGGPIVTHLELAERRRAIEFAVVMRRFLAPDSDLCFRAVWSYLRSEHGESLDPALIDRVEAGLRHTDEPVVPIRIDDEQMTGERIYELVAAAGFFSDDPSSVARLRQLSGVPVMGELFWLVFHTYGEGRLLVLSAILDAVRAIETLLPSTSVTHRCIYCLRTDGAFASEEHVLPEGLGNQRVLLPCGYACDACNNGQLARLDEALLTFAPLALLRVLYLGHDKRGRLPRAEFEGLVLERTAPRHIVVKTPEGSDRFTFLEDEDGTVRFSIKVREATPWDIGGVARALYKAALGLVALERGHEYACESRFDAARAFIRGEAGFDNWLLVSKQVQPADQIEALRLPIEPGSVFLFDIYGVRFVLNLELAPAVASDAVVHEAGFEPFHLAAA